MSHPRIAGRPRYAVVAQALTEDILSGRYPVGGVMPTEHALCTQFNISRHTTREALRRLQALGLGTRRAGVAPSEVRQRIIATTLTHDEAAKLKAAGGDPALRITRRYLTDTSETYVVAVNLYPAGRFTYSNTLRVEQPETAP